MDAFPELTEDMLRELPKRLKDTGRLVGGFCSPEMIMGLVNVWKQLKAMA